MKLQGTNINDLINMSWNDLNKLSTKELRELSMKLNSAANKRLRRIETSGKQEFSPAYQYTRRGRGDFSVKGLTTRTQIKNEIQRASSFLEAKTSTLKGVRQYEKETKELFGDQEAPEDDMSKLTKKQKNTIFRALDRLRETNAAAVYNVGSDIIIKELRMSQKRNKSRNRYQLIKDLEKRYPELLESSEERYEREEAERQARTDEDGIFHTLSPAESEENPFK